MPGRRRYAADRKAALAAFLGTSKAKEPHGRTTRTSNILAGHVRAFQAVRSQLYDNITLWSCRINGEPGVAIVMVDQVGEQKLAIMPLFVAITEGMDLAFDDEDSASESEEGGGPTREEVAQAFSLNKEALEPGGS